MATELTLYYSYIIIIYKIVTEHWNYESKML